MIDFKLGSNGDILIENGKFVLLSTIQEAVRQRLQTVFRTYQGEWFLNTTYGMPYRQQIIGKGLSKVERDALYISKINEDPDVQRIVYFNSSDNRINRIYDVQFEVLTSDGLLNVETLYETVNDEIEYPEVPEFSVQPTCTFSGILPAEEGTYIESFIIEPTYVFSAPIGTFVINI
jgi:hypothetical protein